MRFYKQITIVIICLFFVTLTMATTAHADQAIIETDHLNVRTGPGTNFEKIDQVNTNEKYQIIQIQGDWVEIELGDQSGWITAEYITIEQQSQPDNIEEEKESSNGHTTAPSTQTSITISHENTQIRKGPSIDDEIITFVEKDQQLEVISENENWYEVMIDGTTGFVFKELINHSHSNPVNHLENKTIVIDAGHGGRDVGAIGINGTYEKTFTMKTTSELTNTLTILGANVILTRSSDDYIRLASRPMLANVSNADAFLSIHYNSFTDLTSVDGIDTYYYHDYDKTFADTIQNEIIYGTNDNDRGIHHGNFQVLRQNHQPALLLELGFISNPEKEKLLLTNGYQNKLVQGITTGLYKYFAK